MAAVKDKAAWLVAGLLTGVIIGILIMTLNGRTLPAPIFISPAAPLATTAPTVTAGPLRIYISGEVSEPAVYDVPAGAIVQDAVRAAGGFTAEANTESVNLALQLADGMHIHVPAVGDPAGGPAVRQGSVILGNDPLVNINLATLAELETLPGIGPSTAQKIIDFRQANGPFQTIEDIMNVSGIGPGKYEQIKDLIVAN